MHMRRVFLVASALHLLVSATAQDCADIATAEGADCATYIAGGNTCEAVFCADCPNAGYCDTTCASVLGSCSAECRIPGTGGNPDLSCAAYVASGTDCDTLTGTYGLCTSCPTCAPPPPTCADVATVAPNDCASLIAAGNTCAATFCDTCAYAGYCDTTCAAENGACTADCTVTGADGSMVSCAGYVASGTTCDTLTGTYGVCTSCPTCVATPPPPPGPPPAPTCADVATAAPNDCASLIAAGNTCAATFCATCAHAGYCDTTCASVLGECTADCTITAADGGLTSCAGYVASGQTCAVLTAAGHCTNCPTCIVAPETVPTVQRQTSCADSVFNQRDVDFGAGACASAVAAGYSCDTDFTEGGVAEVLGVCNKECQYNFLDHPLAWGLNAATAETWLGLAELAPLVAAIGTAIGQPNIAPAAAAAQLAPGICQTLVSADPGICAAVLNADSAAGGLASLYQTHGMCDFACPCQCTETTDCPLAPPLHGTCRASDLLDHDMTNGGLGVCAAYLHGGDMTCSAEPATLTTSVDAGGSYAGYCSLGCEYNRIEHPKLYGWGDGSGPQSITYQIAEEIVMPLLTEMGETVTVADAVARMTAQTVNSTARSPGLCEQVIASLGYDRVCRGGPGNTTGFYPGVLNPALCTSGAAPTAALTTDPMGLAWGSLSGVCTGLCEFACGDCQNTDPVAYVAPDVQHRDCLHGGCCSVTNPTDYAGDHADCPAIKISHGCDRTFAPDRIFNQCAEGGNCCDHE